MYRDEHAAAEARIRVLEDRLADQAAQLAELGERIHKRDAHIDALLAAFKGTRGATYRRWKALALACGAALVGTVIATEVRVRTAHRAQPALEVALAAPTAVVMADPLDQIADPSERSPYDQVKPPLPARAACSPDDPSCEVEPALPAGGERNFDERRQKAALWQKLLDGSASVTELQMLKAICMNDGDRACRNAAAAAIVARAADDMAEFE